MDGTIVTDIGGSVGYASTMCSSMCIAFAEKLLICIQSDCNGST